MVWNTPLASLGQLSWVCPLPAPAASLACSLAGQSEKLRSPWLGVSTALQQLKHQHVISSLLILIQNIAPCQLLGGKLTLSYLKPGYMPTIPAMVSKFSCFSLQPLLVVPCKVFHKAACCTCCLLILCILNPLFDWAA